MIFEGLPFCRYYNTLSQSSDVSAMGYFNGSNNGSRVVYCRYIYAAGLWLMKDSKHDSIDEYDKSCVIVKRAWGNYVNICTFCDYNRELKQIRFWAADVNRKFMFLLLARFHARPASYKALISAFTTWHFEWKGWNTHQRGEVSTSGWRPWLKNVCA